ncbi:serine/threonine-protein kinase nekl-3-like isoform X1 [Aphis craccivora]|uniref:non-specific serine/threonine protein kinase n=1 Tax=Aphis craccivora TaxID=307492 RepID=A0A6G0ZPT6_APHCR|nr:serine/threonine-protein kinase nekl-3-like isoform X1 [Aphis craccivora]
MTTDVVERQSCRRVIFDRVLGKGAFSTVYKALVQPDNEHIALKIVHLRNIVNDLKTVQDCVNEISNLKKLNHSNIIRCFWWDFSDFELKIGLELATGGDLRRIIQEHYDEFSLIKEPIIWSCAVQLSSALYHMHTSRIMHRDIKPANIFVYGLKEERNSLYERWKEVKIKLGDFGFSKDITNGVDMTCRSVLGSPLYMSPERMLHQKYYFDSDVWSMACVIYELVALQAPFHLNTLDMNLMTKRIINGFYPPIPSDIYSIKITNFIDSCIIVDHKFRPNISQILRVTRRGLAESRNTALSS